ncbi:MAG: cadherin repeat domain-containing protein, partial [Planctomycetaceae bacterium]|nr:cadherin repeat domain-containing protein [Planctomycetaceae bacterium]
HSSAGNLFNKPGDLVGVNPRLDDLKDNGGPTPTHALLPDSPALDAGAPDLLNPSPNVIPPTTDQRGFLRPGPGLNDIGAFEFQNSLAIEDQSFSIEEHSENGTVIAQVATTGGDGPLRLFSITGGNDSGAIAIAANGTLTVADASQLDFEKDPTFVLEVMVTDGRNVVSANITVTLIDVQEFPIDIQPDDPNNTVDLKKKSPIEVVIYSTADFDATQINVETLRFGATGTEDSLRRRGKNQNPQIRWEDVDGDGRLDLVASFDVSATGLSSQSTQATLTGETLTGEQFATTQFITISQGNGKGNGKGKGK